MLIVEDDQPLRRLLSSELGERGYAVPGVSGTTEPSGTLSFALGVRHRKILLVVPHHRHQDFFGQFEKLRIEAALDGTEKKK